MFLYAWMKLHSQSWDWNLGLTCWMSPHPHHQWFHSTYWKLLLSDSNASTVQVNNNSSNQPLSVINRTSLGMHVSKVPKKKCMRTKQKWQTCTQTNMVVQSVVLFEYRLLFVQTHTHKYTYIYIYISIYIYITYSGKQPYILYI